jgi:hypothetical protein
VTGWVIGFLAGLATSLLTGELTGLLDRCSHWLIRRAVRVLPVEERGVRAEELAAELTCYDGMSIARLVKALGCWVGMRRIASSRSRRPSRTRLRPIRVLLAASRLVGMLRHRHRQHKPVPPRNRVPHTNAAADDRADAPLDPFLGDPGDPAAVLDDLEAPDPEAAPLTPAEREDVLADLEDLEVFQTLLEQRGVRGIVVECGDCGESHYFGWGLMRGNLGHLLDAGRTRVHEPAFGPDPTSYVSWEYARGFADGVFAAAEETPRKDRRGSAGIEPATAAAGHERGTRDAAGRARQPGGAVRIVRRLRLRWWSGKGRRNPGSHC